MSVYGYKSGFSLRFPFACCSESFYLFICYRCHIMGHHLTFTCWNYFLVLSTIRGKESESRTLGMIADKLQIQDTTDKKTNKKKNKSYFTDGRNTFTVLHVQIYQKAGCRKPVMFTSPVFSKLKVGKLNSKMLLKTIFLQNEFLFL